MVTTERVSFIRTRGRLIFISCMMNEIEILETILFWNVWSYFAQRIQTGFENICNFWMVIDIFIKSYKLIAELFSKWFIEFGPLIVGVLIGGPPKCVTPDM